MQISFKDLAKLFCTCNKTLFFPVFCKKYLIRTELSSFLFEIYGWLSRADVYFLRCSWKVQVYTKASRRHFWRRHLWWSWNIESKFYHPSTEKVPEKIFTWPGIAHMFKGDPKSHNSLCTFTESRYTNCATAVQPPPCAWEKNCWQN